MKEFRKQIVTSQGKMDICQLCSGYGVPALNRSRPMGFEVQRMSLDQSKLDIPEDEWH